MCVPSFWTIVSVTRTTKTIFIKGVENDTCQVVDSGSLCRSFRHILFIKRMHIYIDISTRMVCVYIALYIEERHVNHCEHTNRDVHITFEMTEFVS